MDGRDLDGERDEGTLGRRDEGMNGQRTEGGIKK